MTWRFPVLVLAVAGAAVAASPWPQPAAADPPARPADKWEYAAVSEQDEVTWSGPGQAVTALNWYELADKLGAPGRKQGQVPATVRVLVLNHLGSQGWELVTHAATPDTDRRRGSNVYTLKRRVP